MKRDNYLRLIKLLVSVGTLATLAACQNSHSTFTDSSQGTMVVDTKPGTNGETGLAREGAGMPEGVGRFGGNYYYIHNGAAIRLAQRQRFVEGYSYDGHGRVVSRRGRIIRLAPGEMVTFAGERIPVPPAISHP